MPPLGSRGSTCPRPNAAAHSRCRLRRHPPCSRPPGTGGYRGAGDRRAWLGFLLGWYDRVVSAGGNVMGGGDLERFVF
jgi:hypothetical protein